jgi:L-ribulose-5-phosphate 4-epimerase
MIAKLKEAVCQANKDLAKRGLVTLTWGNASGFDRANGLFVIKPSGVDFEALTPDDMVVVDMNGNNVEGRYRPSSDMPTHLELYKAFANVGGVVHTHSPYATSWAQAGRNIPCYGTTHADYFYGEIPCIRYLDESEILYEYEKNTGKMIVGEVWQIGRDPDTIPGILCQNHGPFTWGKDVAEALRCAIVLEEVARMAYMTEIINHNVKPAPQALMDKHYYRMHGDAAYYGQHEVNI